MGFNLKDALAGAAQGFGTGMAMNAKFDMDTQAQEETDRRRSELEMQKQAAFAKMQRELTAPDREFDQGLRMREADRQDRSTTASIDNMQQTRELSRDQLGETSRHNKATEQIGANNTEARISIAEMNAENRRLAASLRDAEKSAQLPKEQIEYLKGFSTNRGKVLSDTLMPEAEKKKALAALDADLYANYPPMVQQNDKGQFRTRDVLGRTKTFASEKELVDAGFAAPSGSGGSAKPADAKQVTSNQPTQKKDPYSDGDYLRLASQYGYRDASESELQKIITGNDQIRANAAKAELARRGNTKEPSLIDFMNGGNYGAMGVSP